jgi:hypothetical protein
MSDTKIGLIDLQTITDDQREALIRFEMSKYLEKPCPICGKEWKDVQELIDSNARYAGDGAAAHETCWNNQPAK